MFINGHYYDSITLDEFMHRISMPDFYGWLNLLRGARGRYHYWSGV